MDLRELRRLVTTFVSLAHDSWRLLVVMAKSRGRLTLRRSLVSLINDSIPDCVKFLIEPLNQILISRLDWYL